MSIFAGKTLMITDGTGSFGNAPLNRHLRTDIIEKQNKILHWRRARHSVMPQCHARR